MRIMGLDFGEKNIGVAISDPTGLIAQGITTVRRTGDLSRDVETLRQLARDWGVDEIVVGLPKNMDGSRGVQATRATEFAEGLTVSLGLPAVLWDERLTTVIAERTLIQGDLSRRKRRKVIDRVAAAVMLQSFLDSQMSKG